MIEIVNTFLSRFRYSAWGPLTKNKEGIQNFKEAGDSRYIYENEPDKACFQHDMAYGDFKDLTRRTAFDKILRDKAFNVAKNSKYDGYQRGLAYMVYERLHAEKLKMKLFIIKKQLKNYTNQLLEKLKKQKYTHLLRKIFVVLILLICN